MLSCDARVITPDMKRAIGSDGWEEHSSSAPPLLMSIYSEADLSWLDECNCFRCKSCRSIVPLGFTVCTRCGGALTAATVACPPSPRNQEPEPDNGFECFECGLLWRRESEYGCPGCGGLLIPVRVDEELLD